MRAVIQLVKSASVAIEGKIFSEIKNGFVVLLGISKNDKDSDIDYIIDKIINLRVFKDKDDKMNENINSINGDILIVSQFTLYGDARKGRRPSYSEASSPDEAEKTYNRFIDKIKNNYNPDKIFTGKFQAMMDVSLINNGPVTILLDSEKLF